LNPQETVAIDCPYCGEALEVAVDCTVARQDYVEDCQVCCRPIELRVRVDSDGVPAVDARHQDE